MLDFKLRMLSYLAYHNTDSSDYLPSTPREQRAKMAPARAMTKRDFIVTPVSAMK